MADDDKTFFEVERDRLAEEIANGFELLLSSVNVLNRKLEDVHGMTKEYETIASLWSSFHQLMRHQAPAPEEYPSHTQSLDYTPQGLPGTGGHVLSARKQQPS